MKQSIREGKGSAECGLCLGFCDIQSSRCAEDRVLCLDVEMLCTDHKERAWQGGSYKPKSESCFPCLL